MNEKLAAIIAENEGGKMAEEEWRNKYDLISKLIGTNHKKIEALQATLTAKQALIKQLSGQVGATALPTPLTNALADWARNSDMVDFNEKTGIVRLKSDLLFDKGSDSVQTAAADALKSFSAILNSTSAQGFDVLIVGHTDDIPVKKPATLAKHPTNWHLSAHRAISVEKALAAAGCDEQRLSVMGMGQFRPIEPNLPGQKGNPKNRRVEIYIVPAGQIHIAGAVN